MQNQGGDNGVDSCKGDHDLVLLDGDIKRSTINSIPSIEFSDRINQLLIAHIVNSVVVKLLGRNIGFVAL